VVAVAEPGGDGVNVGLDRQGGGGVHFAARDAGVARVLAAGLDALAVSAGKCLAPGDRLGVELHLQSGGLGGELVVAQARRERGEDLVGAGGVGGAEAEGVAVDDARAVCVDGAVGHRGQRARQAGREVRRLADAGGGVVGGGDELHCQFLVGVLSRSPRLGDLA
jgi:hypothetical protein